MVSHHFIAKVLRRLKTVDICSLGTPFLGATQHNMHSRVQPVICVSQRCFHDALVKFLRVTGNIDLGSDQPAFFSSNLGMWVIAVIL